MRKGERIGIWSPNRAEWTLVQYASAKIGAILVNINPSYRAGELRFALRQSGCRMLFSAKRFRDTDFEEIVASVRTEVPGLEQVVFFGDDAWLETGRVDATRTSDRRADGAYVRTRLR